MSKKFIDYYLEAVTAKQGSGGGGSATLINKNVSANGTYNASSDSADGYKKVVVSVPNTYEAGDEGKVVSSGALVAQSAHAKVTQNGTIDTTLNNSVEVDVPNTYAAGDEGKVVSSGALVAQSAYGTVTQNGTIDTTLFNSVVVNVSGGGGGSSDMVKGSFKADSAVDEYVINVPYSGSKMLKYILIRAQGNPQTYQPNTYTQGTIVDFVMVKSTDVAPDYATASSNDNRAAFLRLYKSGATTIQGTGNAIMNTYLSDATTYPNSYSSANSNHLHVRSNTKFSVVTRDASSGTSRYGFDTSITYDYYAIYD